MTLPLRSRLILAIFVAVVAGHSILMPAAVVSADIGPGMLQLCIDQHPDGTALMDTPSGQPVMMLFKADNFWVIDVNYLVGAILDPLKRRSTTMSVINAIDVQNVMPNFPTGHKRIVSLSGLNSTNPLQNSIMVFHENQMTRYKVHHLEGGARMGRAEQGSAHDTTQALDQTKPNVSATLEGDHNTKYWPHFPKSLYDLYIIFQIPRSRLLMSHTRTAQTSRGGYFSTLYLLNHKSLDKPIGLNHILEHAYPYQGSGVISHHRLAGGEQMDQGGAENGTTKGTRHLSLLRRGLVCYELLCAPLREFMTCDASVDVYTSGLAYWIQYETEMTFRLLMGALVACLIISLSISLTFTYNQLKKMMELT